MSRELAVARVERWVPGLRLVREYRRSWLASDLIAGLSCPLAATTRRRRSPSPGALAVLTRLIVLVAGLAVGATGIVVILVVKRFWRAVPGVAVAVLVGIAAVLLFDLDAEGVEILGVLPEGLPAFAFPAVDAGTLGALISGALGIALVAVADTTVLSQSLAAQRGETVDPDQELRALGAANLATGLFQGFAISSSSSRTPVAVAAGARSQVTPWSGL